MGNLNFIVIICSQDLWGASRTTCTWMDAFTHLYIPSSMLWKGSDLIVAAGKSTEEHFAVKDLSDGVKGFFFFA